MSTTTPRWGMSKAALPDPADAAVLAAGIADVLDPASSSASFAPRFRIGTTLPAANACDLFLNTSTGALHTSDGSTWRPLMPSQALPVGMYGHWGGSGDPVDPDGVVRWLARDGRSLLRTDYPALFAVFGTSFGAADSTHFALPDARGRLDVGAGQGSGLSNRALGGTGGEETHPLTAGENGPHGHGVSDPGHAHAPGGGGYFAQYAGGSGVVYQNGAGEARPGSTVTNPATTGIGVNASGSGTPHENMPPWLAGTPLVKAR